MAFTSADLLSCVFLELGQTVHANTELFMAQLELVFLGKRWLQRDMTAKAFHQLKDLARLRPYLFFQQALRNATYSPTDKKARFEGSRTEIRRLEAFLDLLQPVFEGYPWSQMASAANTNLTVMAGCAKRVLDAVEASTSKDVHHSKLECLHDYKTEILAEYDQWKKVVDPNGLGQTAFEAFNDLSANYEHHMRRNGKMRYFPKLPQEVQQMIVLKVINYRRHSVDSTGRHFMVHFAQSSADAEKFCVTLGAVPRPFRMPDALSAGCAVSRRFRKLCVRAALCGPNRMQTRELEMLHHTPQSDSVDEADKNVAEVNKC